MMRRTPLARKRPTPRITHPERVQHGSVKEKYTPYPTHKERRHKGRVKGMPCIGCGAPPRSEAHHTMMDFPEKRWRRDHRYLLPVCFDCHRGKNGIHGIGDEAEWGRRNGLNTAAIAQALWAESEEKESAA